jgi:hypothetical protein
MTSIPTLVRPLSTEQENLRKIWKSSQQLPSSLQGRWIWLGQMWLGQLGQLGPRNCILV